MLDDSYPLSFDGSGSSTGNAWTEEIRYLGGEQWLLLLADDGGFCTAVLLPANPNSAVLLRSWMPYSTGTVWT
ncbi:MAG: hypothetical protein ACI9K5_004190 [Gammaproteobacteria bacterium]|jgi:hypothetical protein